MILDTFLLVSLAAIAVYAEQPYIRYNSGMYIWKFPIKNADLFIAQDVSYF